MFTEASILNLQCKSQISDFNFWVNGVFKHKLDQQDPYGCKYSYSLGYANPTRVKSRRVYTLVFLLETLAK